MNDQADNHFLLYEMLRKGQGPEFQMDEEMKRRMFLQKLMEMMQRRHGQAPQPPDLNRPTWSDTPGRGNVPPFQMPGTNNMPENIPQPPMQGPRNQQMQLEKYLLDKYLNNSQVMAQFQDFGRDRRNFPGSFETGFWDDIPVDFRIKGGRARVM